MAKKLIISVLFAIAPLLFFSQNMKNRFDATKEKLPVFTMKQKPGIKNPLSHTPTPGLIKYRLDSAFYEDKTDGYWDLHAKMNYTYSADENILERNFYMKVDNTGEWELAFSNEYIYNENGQIIEMLYDTWDYYEEEWISFKYEYSYDDAGNKIQEVEYEWDAADLTWYEVYRTGYIYEAGRLEEVFEYEWDDAGQTWYDVWKIEYIYDAQNYLGQEIGYEKDAGEWYYAEKTEYSYDANGYLAEEICYLREGGEWLYDCKYEHEFDANGNYVHSIEYFWDDVDLEFVPDEKMEFNYNNDYSFNELIVPTLEEYELIFNHMLTDHLMTHWDEDLEQWDEISRGTMYYTEVESSEIKNIHSEKIALFPNPAENIIKIHTGAAVESLFKIYDLKGKSLLSENNIQSGDEINISCLQPGIYIYKLTTKHKISTGKLIVK